MSDHPPLDPARRSSPGTTPDGDATPETAATLRGWCRAQARQFAAAADTSAPSAGHDLADLDLAAQTLPPDRPPRAHAPARVERHALRLSPALTRDLHAAAERARVPAPLLLLSAWTILVQRYGGRPGQRVGVIFESAADEVAPDIVLATTYLDGAHSIDHALGEVGGALARACAARRDPSTAATSTGSTPFWFRDPAAGAAAAADFDHLGRENDGAPPAVVLEPDLHHEPPTLALAYDGDRFERGTVERLLERYQQVLDHVVRDPAQPLAALSLMSAEDHALVDALQTRRPYPAEATIHGTFEQHVAASPQATALIWGQREMSYETLDRLANASAQRLIALGVRPGARVGICMKRSIDMVVALLATLKAGCAYVAFAGDTPPERLAFQLEDAALAAIFVDELAPWSERPEPCLAPERTAPDRVLSPDVPGDPEALAYLCYTSGTTGRPKAVMVPHRGVIRLLFGVEYAHLGPDETLLHLAPIAFDASTFEIWAALLHGGRCVLYPDELPTGTGIAALLRQHRVTILWLTSALFNAIIDEDPGDLRGPRQIVTGGEALSVVHVKRALAALPDTQLCNVYGPTEVTTFATCQPIASAHGERASIPIGTPIGDTQAYILDDDGALVPPLVPGELHLGGAGVARGYWRRPELTARAFLPDPFAADAEARMYRTGDRARLLLDGSIEFLGRMDHQVKMRGFRIELEEIEAVLRELPGVRDAGAAVWRDAVGLQLLVAHVVTDPGVSLPAVQAGLRERLPPYMVPGRLLPTVALPRTANGKLDRRALAMPDWTSAPGDGVHVPPRSPAEVTIAEVWQEVLGVDRVGANDSFRALGGHSLLATQVIVRLRERLRQDVPLRLMFEADTVSALATEIARLANSVDDDGAGADLHPLRPQPRPERLPLSFSQERVWFIQQMDPQANAYNFQATIRFRGALDEGALRRAMDEIVHRHENLRATFEAHDGRPYQIIHPPQPAWLQIEDLQSVSRADREQAVQARMQRELGAPFALDRLPLVRWTLLRLAPDDHLLIQVEHHLVHDGWSFHVLLRELVALYRAFIAGQPSPLAPLPVQFADFALWQRAWMDGAPAARQRAYWREQLRGLRPVWRFPLDRPRPRHQSMRGRSLRLELAPDLADAARALARRHDATLFQMMFAVYACLLFRYTGDEDLCVGTGIANRSRREIEGLIGMVINTIALRVDLAGEPTFAELLARVKQVTRAGYANQDIPFDQVVDVLKLKRTLAYSPIYQTTFSFHDAPMPELDLPGLDIELQEGLSNGSAKFDLNVIMMPRAEQNVRRGATDGERGITMLWEYSTDLLDRDTVERLVHHYETLLAALTDQPDQPIATAPLADEDERRAARAGFARAAAPVDYIPLVHQRVAEHAAHIPDAIAVRDGDRTLRYAELDRRANQLARALRRHGVGNEDLVALCMDHGVERVVAQLAVLKAGAAFVSLDPALPAERLGLLLNECRARAVITRDRDAAVLPDGARPVLHIDANWKIVDGLDDTALDVRMTHRNLAYAVLASAPDGHPRAVLVEHHSLAHLAHWHQTAFGVTAADRAAVHADLTGDASVWELWPYLAQGASLTVVPRAVRDRPERLCDWLVENHVTLACAPAPLAATLTARPWPAEVPLRALLVTGGDPESRPPGTSLPFAVYEHRGVGESAGVVTSGLIAVAAEPARVPTVGAPVPHARVYVLDPALEPTPVGAPGEIYIGGAGVARGYIGHPDQTAERFLCDPFTTAPGARMYRTGERGRVLADGQLQLLAPATSQARPQGDDAAASGEVGGGAGGEAPVAPRTELEETVSAIWREVLARDGVGVHDNFFAIGGHSLLAAQIIARIEHRLTVRLPLKVIFDGPTVAELCARIAAEERREVERIAIEHRLAPEELLERIDDLSDDEVELLLRAMKREEGHV